jgi:hypothetical protein
MILATIVAIIGGIIQSDALTSAAIAMITASGTSFQIEAKHSQKIEISSDEAID